MFARGETIAQLIERLAPKAYAVPDDKIGLQVGSLQREIGRVLVALDVTTEVVDEAIARGCELIIAHHAVIYRPLAHLRTDTPAGALAAKLIKSDLAVYIAHTNLDSAEGGVNDWMAEALGLEGREVLKPLTTNPQGVPIGLGRVGKLPKDESLDDFAERVKAAFDVPFVRLVGPADKIVRKVAVLGGSGSHYVRHAIFAGADALVTGDIDYHTAHDALAAGLALVDPGHHVEQIMKIKLANWLNAQLKERKYETEAIPSQIATEPFRFK